jgi:hypothetical protein
MVLKGDALVVDENTLSKCVRKISFELDDTKKEKSVLYWEGEMKNGSWIGGAVGFEKGSIKAHPKILAPKSLVGGL